MNTNFRNRNRMRSAYGPLACIALLIITFIVYLLMLHQNVQYATQGMMLMLCNAFMICCLFFILTRHDFYMFDPALFSFFLYYMIFVFVPIKNISEDKVTEFGVNVMGGCVKGTLIFMVGYVSMLIGYFLKGNFTFGSRSKPKQRVMVVEPNPMEIDSAYRQKVLIYSWIFWGIGVGSFLLFMMSIGQNPLYMFTLGLKGTGNGSRGNYSVSFLSQLIYLSFYPLLNIVYYEKSKVLKLIAVVGVCVPLITRGFRNVVVVVLAGIVVYRYVREKKKMPLRVIAMCLAIFFFIFGIMGITRNFTRKGKAIDLSSYEYSDGIDGVLYYFETYKCYYGAVEHYPADYNYTMGKQLLYAITMYIPRSIWPGKPDTPVREVLANSTSALSATAGSIMPNIGEYYTDLGVVGVIGIMFIFGRLLRNMRHLYYNNGKKYRWIMLYALYLPSLVTIIPYGYTAGNAPPFVLMAVPAILQGLFINDQ